ncbi:tetratricopeptide repeat protein, partial [Patescibacteria group bacterium]|nr:tetratricopeptide repeat protein [Patescibacteria group bacterium]
MASAWFAAAPQGQVSIYYGIKGFSKTVVSDRASSLMALGWGWENHDVLFNKYYHSHYLEKGVISIGIWRDRSHNQVMDILALTGILGILAYFAVFISLFWLLFRKIKKEAVLKIKITVGILGLMFMAYFVQNLSAFDTPAPLIVFYFGLGLVYFITESKNLQIDMPTRNVLPSNAGGNIRITNKKTLLIILVIISFPFIIYKFNLQPFWQSNFSVKGALISQTDLKSGLIFFKKALEKSSFVSPEIRAQLVISVNEAKNKGIADQKTLTEGLEFGISEIEKSIKEHPLDVRNYLYLGKLYNIKGVYDPSYLVKSEKILKTALELSPKREEVLYELGWVKLLKGEYEEAIEIYKEILSSNENIKKSHWYLGLSYLVAEEYDKGIKEIEKAYDYYITYESPDMLLFIGQTYAKLEKYDQAISLCNTVLSRQPKNITAMSQKVIYLAKSGNKNEALKIIERVSKIDPETAKELKKIIDSL